LFTATEFGSCLFAFDPAKNGAENCPLKNPVYVAGWRGRNSASSMMDKQEKVSLLCRYENVEIPEHLKAATKGKDVGPSAKRSKKEENQEKDEGAPGGEVGSEGEEQPEDGGQAE